MSRMTERLRRAGFVIHSRPAATAVAVWRDTRARYGKKLYPQPEAYRIALERLKAEGRE